MKRKVGIKLLSLLGLLLSSCSFLDFFNGYRVEMISVEGEKSEIFVDEELELKANVFPSNASNKEVTWKVNDEAVASVTQKGVVKGLKEGNTVVEVSSKEDSSIKGTFDLKVITPSLVSISVKSQPTKLRYYEGDYFNPSGLAINTVYNNSTTKTVTYSNSTKADFSFTPSLTTTLTLENTKVRVAYKTKTVDIDIVVREEGSIDKTPVAYTYDDYMKNNYYDNMDNCPLTGSPKLLIIPIWFNDSNNFIDTSKKASVRSDIQKAYTGSTSDTGWQSVKTFYETESFGKITLSATVADWYNVNESYLNYAPESAVTKTVSLVDTASNAYFTNHSSDSRKNYDSNNDGYLDGVMLIYAAPDYQSLHNESYGNLWAYCYWTSNYSNKTSPTADVFFWASYDFMYGSNATSKTGHSYSRGYTEHGVTIDTHCLIHEMGHVFGVEDYYDYSDQFNPAGGFSMQDANVGGHDPYSVMAYGWAEPYIPDRTMTISIGDFQSTHDFILLANHELINSSDSYKFSPFDEYLLIEYYTPTGLNKFDSDYQYLNSYPQGPSEPGIRLWHVDARLCRYSSITTIPSSDVRHVMSNSYGENHGSPFGEDYYDYNLLQFIRKDTSKTYQPTGDLDDGNLFKAEDTFTMSTYGAQFVNTGKMNDNKALGWSFRVDSITAAGATITVTKA